MTQVASLEDRWADVHNTKGELAGVGSNAALNQLVVYMTQGHQYRYSEHSSCLH